MTADGRHDFDFLFGTWHATNRSLSRRLVGSNEWTQFPSTLICRPLLGGMMNVDELIIPGRPGGVTVRVFDPDTGLWSVYWIAAGLGVDIPVVGSFRDGIGEFFSDDTYEGTPIRVLYRWDATKPMAPQWTQAFSTDGGQTWELNWVADFTRAEAAHD